MGGRNVNLLRILHGPENAFDGTDGIGKRNGPPLRPVRVQN